VLKPAAREELNGSIIVSSTIWATPHPTPHMIERLAAWRCTRTPHHILRLTNHPILGKTGLEAGREWVKSQTYVNRKTAMTIMTPVASIQDQTNLTARRDVSGVYGTYMAAWTTRRIKTFGLSTSR